MLCYSIEYFVRLGRGRLRRSWSLCVEEEQVGLCEPERSDEDPWTCAVVWWCKQANGIAGKLK